MFCNYRHIDFSVRLCNGYVNKHTLYTFQDFHCIDGHYEDFHFTVRRTENCLIPKLRPSSKNKLSVQAYQKQ